MFPAIVKGKVVKSRPEERHAAWWVTNTYTLQHLDFFWKLLTQILSIPICAQLESSAVSQSSKLQAKLAMHDLIKISFYPTSRISDWNEFHQLYTFVEVSLVHSSWLAYCCNGFGNVCGINAWVLCSSTLQSKFLHIDTCYYWNCLLQLHWTWHFITMDA